MKPHKDLEETAALCQLIRYSGSSGASRSLLETYGSAQSACAAGLRAWRAAGLSASACDAMLKPDKQRIDLDLAWYTQSDQHQILAWQDENYPALLRYVDSPPAALFVAGDSDALWYPQIAVVGSRHASHAGKQIAHAFAQTFAQSGWMVTSGLAQGIDTFAHQGAIDANGVDHPRTLAVVATGLDLVYPASNEALMQAIARCGAVVSEHPPGTAPLREHFPSRNRMIAGLSVGCVVIEAAQRSGALITARLAGELGKEIFAVPGSIQNPMTRGCHQLIRQGAALVEQAEEVIEVLAISVKHLAEALRGALKTQALVQVPLPFDNAALPQQHAIVYEALSDIPCTLDELCTRTGLTASELSSMLLVMEMKGRVAQLQGRYIRLI